MARLVVRMQMPPGLETGGGGDEETEEHVHDDDDYDDDDYDPDEMLDNYMHEYVSSGVGVGAEGEVGGSPDDRDRCLDCRSAGVLLMLQLDRNEVVLKT